MKSDSPEQRIEQLEQHVKNLRIALVLVALAIPATSWVSAKNESVPSIVKARAFHVLDENGRSRISLSIFAGAPRIGLDDDKGKSRVMLIAHKDRGELAVGDSTGNVIWRAP